MILPAQSRVLVTGAGSGLGRAFCEELAHRKARVLAVDIDLGRAQETANLCSSMGADVRPLQCDVSQAQEFESLANEAERAFGGIDLLINNAGVAVGGPVGVVPLEDWAWILGVNLWGVIHGCHTFVPRFRAKGSGHVLNVASAAGLIALPEMGAYNVTKSGVVALSETLASELEGTGVGATVLCPTFFKTNIARDRRSTGEDVRPEAIERIMSRSKVQAPEVARAALAAVEAGRLYALPHADGRWLWRLKRLMPETLQRRLLPGAARSMQRRRRASP